MKSTQKALELPLSKKFYAGLHGRIQSAILTVNSELYSLSYCRVFEAIDAYLQFGIIPDAATSVDVRLVFHLMKPEIDKAIVRSERARAAAVRRREARAGREAVAMPEAVAQVEETAAAVADMAEPENADIKNETNVSPVPSISESEMPESPSESVDTPSVGMISGGDGRRRRRHGWRRRRSGKRKVKA